MDPDFVEDPLSRDRRRTPRVKKRYSANMIHALAPIQHVLATLSAKLPFLANLIEHLSKVHPRRKFFQDPVAR